MKAMISTESYEMVQKMANKFAYGNTRTNLYELYVNAGIEGLNKAVSTYKENSDVLFSTYLYRCVMNALINEQKRLERQNLQEDENVILDNYKGATTEMVDDNFEEILRKLIRKYTTNERNAKIVELNIGLNCEPMELKEIAEDFNLSHESVRLVCVKTIKALRADKVAQNILYSFVG